LKYFFALVSIFIIVGCSSKDAKPVVIDDMVNIPQDVSVFVKNADDNVNYYDIQNEYEQNYFSIWNIDKPEETLDEIKWPFDTFKVGESYGENLQLLDQSFFDEMYENSNFSNYATVNKRAVTLKYSNIRAFPTVKPLLKDPSLAGEGFPFDYLQNSSIEANKPIFVSHYSKDREWVYVFSSFASGWLKARDIAFIPKKYTDKWQNAQQVFITKDDVPIYSEDGDFLFKSKIGMMMALIAEYKDSYTVLTVSSCNSKPLYLKSKISKGIAHKGIYRLNKDNLKKIMSGVFNTNYGWGGIYEQRDCSSTLRDMFAPFGIWLPRNSFQQSKVGEIISLEDLSDDEKLETIKEKAVPFKTLLYKPGHILLYVGTYKGKVIAFHNTWGIKTEKYGEEGRIVLGKTVFSTLRLGKNQDYYDEDGEILKNLKSMNIITN
jgi:hypothetical protein